MFTGIVEKVGFVRSFESTADGRRLGLDLGAWDALRAGDSLAVNGACLTAVRSGAGWCDFDVVPETLRRTALGDLQAGDPVNLERAVAAGGRFDGHFVQGHVDAVARVTRAEAGRSEHLAWFEHEPDCAPLIVPKGSITIEGVSLTIAQTRPGAFCVALIPATLTRTTLARLRPGQRVNVETDLIARAIAHQLAVYRGAARNEDLAQLLVEEGCA